MTVYVTQEPRPKVHTYIKEDGTKKEKIWSPDLSTAASYGKIVYVFSKDYNPMMDAKKSYQIASAMLEKFDPNDDYLLELPNTGPAPARACIMAIMAKGIDDINFLNFHKRFDKEKQKFTRHSAEYLPQRWSCNYNEFV